MTKFPNPYWISSSDTYGDGKRIYLRKEEPTHKTSETIKVYVAISDGAIILSHDPEHTNPRFVLANGYVSIY